MADTIVSKSKIDAIADAVNTKTGKTGTMTLDEIAQAVKDYDPDQGYTMEQFCDGSAFEGDVVINTVYHSADEKTICVPDHRFRGTGMTSVTINEPSGFYIGGYTFYGCANLTTVYASSCTSVSSNAFYHCSKLNSVAMPRLKSIGTYAFTSTAIDSLDVPLLESVGSTAFDSCYSFKALNAPSIKTIGSSAFIDCRALNFFNGSDLTTIGTSAFMRCYNLKSFVVTEATNIQASAFGTCTALESFDAQSETAGKFSGNNTFSNTSNLSAVILRSNSVWTNSGTSNFYNSKIGEKGGYIYVPKDLIDTYKTATNWVAYADYFRALEDYTTDGTTTGALDSSKI